MAYTTQYSGYVKFLRGTPAAYSAITKDADTLYFISEPNATSGLLYLGNKLISGSVSSATSLSDLQDVLIGAGVSSNSLLVYDATQQKWINKTVSEIFNVIMAEMQGATASTNGVSGLVPVPHAGDQNLFLRGDATWADPTATLTATVSQLQLDVSGLDNSITNLKGVDTGNISIREIAANEVAKVVANAPDSFDTLKEIADWISGHTDTGDIITLRNDVGDLKTLIYDTPAVVDENTGEVITPAVNGLVTRVSNLENIINGSGNNSGLVTQVSTLNTTVGTLSSSFADLEDRVDDIEDDIAAIDNRLKWQNLVQE